MTNWPQIHLDEARGRWWRGKYDYRHRKLVEYELMVKRSRAMHHPQALASAESGVKKWGELVGEAAREVHKYADAVHRLRPQSPVPPGEGTCVPKTSWNPFRRRLANWIARELYDAVDNYHAEGHANSGLRTFAEQTVLYSIFLHGGNVAARPGESNHEGWDYVEPSRSGGKSGAVDWEPAESLNAALLRKREHKLLWAETHGLADHPHFSKTGH